MSSEYVKISRSELVYGESSLLKSQMSILNLKKRYISHRELRKKELLLKIELKKKIEEAIAHLAFLEKLLPHTRLQEEEEQKLKKEIAKSVDKAEEIKENKKIPSIESELEEIQRKLAALQ